MQQEKDNFTIELIKLLLPNDLIKKYEIKNVQLIGSSIHIYLEEKNILPQEYEREKLTSKGFHQEITIQDFPIRDKSVYLHIKRRRWLIESSKEVVSNQWDMVAEGTRMTKDFAFFFKGLLGHISNK